MTDPTVVTWTPVNPSGPILLTILGDGPVRATTAGGWAFTARPRRVAFTEWNGEDPYTMVVPVMFDGHSRDVSVDPFVARLYTWMRNPVGKAGEPQVLRVSGAAIPERTRLWVINGIDWVSEIRNPSGVRTRAALTVTLLEYVAADVLVTRTASPARTVTAGATGTTATKSRTYAVRAGDTLQSIAARVLGKASRSGEIAKLNNIRDGKSLKVGQVLRLPS